MEEIKVKYFGDGFYPLEQKEGSDWIDCRTAQDITLTKGEWCLIPLGFACKLPKGYEAHLVPRSSTFKKYHILMTNSIGIIDESYCGNHDQWMFSAFATEDTMIPKGTRFCQFRIMKKQPKIMFTTVDELEDEDRGGFGSTGEK